MRPLRAAYGLMIGVAACATPGQVRQVQTQVSILDHSREVADSARAADLARIQAAQRVQMDSLNVIYHDLTESIQRLGREDAANFASLSQRLYQIVSLQTTTQSGIGKIRSQIDAGLSSPPPASATPADTTGHGQVPPADVLLSQAQTALTGSAWGSARIALNTLLQTYPQSAQVPDALYWLGNTFDTGTPAQPDSARAYYTRVYKSYPESPYAPTALYKLGAIEKKANNVPAARVYWQLIVDKYKLSDEYGSAQDRLRENP